MKSLCTVITGIFATVALTIVKTTSASALAGGIRSGVEAARGIDMPTTLIGDGGIFTTFVNLLLFLVGAIAVVMIIYGGFRYVISGGDSGAVTTAKNTILYAIIGLVVAALAYAIIDFVLNTVVSGAGTSGL
jgi:hypothetical protein